MPDLPDRYVARIDGDFVIFLIGLRISKPWKVGKWLPAALAMPRMLRELEARGPEAGLLGHSGASMKGMVQYWRSFEQLEAFARDPDGAHWPAWVEFNRRVGQARGDVGIWHETYLVQAGQYETIYSGMPLTGLARAAGWAPMGKGAERARQRLGRD